MEDDMERKEIRLVVVQSSTPGSGVVKIPEDFMKNLGLNDGDFIKVTSWSGTVKLQVKTDTIYTVDRIRMKKDDMHSLGVEEGDRVRVARIRKGRQRQ